MLIVIETLKISFQFFIKIIHFGVLSTFLRDFDEIFDRMFFNEIVEKIDSEFV